MDQAFELGSDAGIYWSCDCTKNIFAFPPIIKLIKALNEIPDFTKYNIKELVEMISQILLLLKTNERKICDLSLIDLVPKFGALTINKKLSTGMKLISESLTGYFSEVIFEVPNGI